MSVSDTLRSTYLASSIPRPYRQEASPSSLERGIRDAGRSNLLLWLGHPGEPYRSPRLAPCARSDQLTLPSFTSTSTRMYLLHFGPGEGALSSDWRAHCLALRLLTAFGKHVVDTGRTCRSVPAVARARLSLSWRGCQDFHRLPSLPLPSRIQDPRAFSRSRTLLATLAM